MGDQIDYNALRNKYKDEKVVVVPASVLTKELLEMDTEDIIRELAGKSVLMERALVEHDAEYRQLIPYIVLADDKLDNVYVIQRINKEREERLVGMKSIGVGGHINNLLDSQDPLESVAVAAYKELFEELNIRFNGEMHSSFSINWVGILCLDSDHVSSCHLGIVVVISMEEGIDAVSVRETDKLKGMVMSYTQLVNDMQDAVARKGYEKWTQEVILSGMLD